MDELEDMDLPPLLNKESSYVDYSKVMRKLHKDIDQQSEARIKKFNKIKAKVLMIARFNYMRIKAQQDKVKMKKLLKDGKVPTQFTNELIFKKFDKITSDIDKFFTLKKIDS